MGTVIEHKAYKDVPFYSGTASTLHQLSSQIRVDNIGCASDDLIGGIKHDIKRVAQHLTESEKELILNNALSGIPQSVYVIRHNERVQGVFILNDQGKPLHVRNVITREKSINLINAVIEIIGLKIKKTHLLKKKKQAILAV